LKKQQGDTGGTFPEFMTSGLMSDLDDDNVNDGADFGDENDVHDQDIENVASNKQIF